MRHAPNSHLMACGWEATQAPDGSYVYRLQGVYGWFAEKQACEFDELLGTGLETLQYPTEVMPEVSRQLRLSERLTDKPNG